MEDGIGTYVGWIRLLLTILRLFSSLVGSYEPILDCVDVRASPETNERLTAPFTAEEFKRAIFQMHLDEASGPDGMNPAFYQNF